jgi:hypothetical protein
MMTSKRRVFTSRSVVRSAYSRLAVIALLTACAKFAVQEPGTTPARSDRPTRTQTQMGEHRFTTAYDAVEALRSNWLHTRGTDSFQTPSVVRVYLDNVSLGDIQTLRNIPVNTVVYIRYFDGVSATARWGLDHGSGVIYVSTRPALADPESGP